MNLAQFLLNLPRSDRASTYLICHSHGGNVALMAMLQSPNLRRVVAGIVCLSTPFFRAKPNDFEDFIKTSRESLGLGTVAGSSFLYFVTVDYLSHRFPALQEPAMWIYAILLLFTMVTSATAHRRLRKQDQISILQRYNYATVQQPVLALRATYDEAFYWLRSSSLAADSLLFVYWAFAVAGLIAYYLTLGIGIMVAIPLILLTPLLFVAGSGLRALVRAAPFTIGEHPITSLLATLSTSARLDIPFAENKDVPVSVTDTHGKFRMRHSALYNSSQAIAHIARFITGQSQQERFGATHDA